MKINRAQIIIASLSLGIIVVLAFWGFAKLRILEIENTEIPRTEETQTDNNNVTNDSVAEGNVFTFAVEADPHMDENSSEDIFKQTLAQINASNPEFVIDLGDTFMTDKLDEKTDTNIKGRFTLMRGLFDILDVPLLLVKGNHDGEAGWDSGTLLTSSKKYREQYFPSVYDKSYYSFVMGDALFVMLDPYIYTETKPNEKGWIWTLGKEQYDWLKTTLETNTSKHKMVFIHQLVGGDDQGRGGIELAKYYEWGGYNLDGSYGFDSERPGWGTPIHQLLIDNNVEIVFKGHDHIYVKQELDGIIYQTLPQPSHLGDTGSTAASYSYNQGEIFGSSGFLKVTVSPEVLKVEYVKYDGTVISTY